MFPPPAIFITWTEFTSVKLTIWMPFAVKLETEFLEFAASATRLKDFFFRIPYRDYSKHHHLFGIVGRHSTSSSACVSVFVCARVASVWLLLAIFRSAKRAGRLMSFTCLSCFLLLFFKIFNRSLWGRPRLSKCWPGSTNQTKCPVQLCERLF